MKKRVFSLLLAIVLILTVFASCTQDPGTEGTSTATGNSDEAETTEDSGEAATVNLAISSGPQSDDLINYLETFETENNIDVNVESIAEASYLQKILLSLSGNEATYDVFMSSNSMWGQMLDPGWVEPLDSYIDNPELTDPAWKDGFSESMLDIVVKDDQRYAVVYQMGTNILYYNKSMLEAAGLDPENPPSTLAEVLEAAEQINDPANEQYGIVFRASREQNTNTFLWVMLWFSLGGDWFDIPDSPDIAVLDRPEAIEATQYFADFHKYAPEGIANYGFEDAMLAFQQGKAAMWIDTIILAGNVLDPEVSLVTEDVGFLTLDEGKSIGSPWTFMMAKNSQVKEPSWQLMQYLTGYDVTWGQTASGIQTAPVRKDVLENPDIEEFMNPELALALSKGLENAAPIYFPIMSQTAEIRASLAVAISDVAAGTISAEDAMIATNDEVISILERDGLM